MSIKIINLTYFTIFLLIKSIDFSTLLQIKFIMTDLMKDHLSKMAYWNKLFGVLGFILIAIMVIAAIGMFFFGSDLDMYGLGAMSGFIYLILGLFYFFPSKYIYGFSKQCRLALNTNSQASISDAFDNLARAFTF